MKHIVYQTSGTCSQQIDLDIDDENRVRNVQFLGGCNGDTAEEYALSCAVQAFEGRRTVGGATTDNDL